MAAFHYAVKAKIIKYIKGNGDIEFFEFEKSFENENPIIARNLAFKEYQNFIDVFLEEKKKEYLSDNQARADLKSFIDPGLKTTFKLRDSEVEFSDAIGNGIGVFFVVDVPKPDKVSEEKEGDEFLIHGIGSIGSHLENENRLIIDLEIEYEYYKFNNYDTQQSEIEVVFCNQDEWAEGYLGNGQWLDTYSEPNTYQILKTPFDWTGYDKPYWWGSPDGEKEVDETQKTPTIIQDLIKAGESNQLEFKPALLFNFSTGKGGIGVKAINAKAICAFLNSNGGFLIIGLSDDGKAKGLTNDFSLSNVKEEKDFFLLEFDDLIKQFFSFSVKSNVSGQFFKLAEKDIFVVTVTPSKRGPVFLKGQNGKEFYVRCEASSRQITDMEELVNYCIEKWGKN